MSQRLQACCCNTQFGACSKCGRQWPTALQVQGYVQYKGYSQPGFPCVASQATMVINQTMIPFTRTYSPVADSFPDNTACNYLTNVAARIGYAEYQRSPNDCNLIGSCDQRPFYIACYGMQLRGREKELFVNVRFEQTFVRSRNRPTAGQCLPYDWQTQPWNGFTQGGIWVGSLDLFDPFTGNPNGSNDAVRVFAETTYSSSCDSPIGTYFYEDERLIVRMVIS